MIHRIENDNEHQTLRLNWILASTGLSGGIKSNRLIAEAMTRRGHTVNIIYSSLPSPSPPFWRIRTFIKYLIRRHHELKKSNHHLQYSSTNLIPVKQRPINHETVPDADFTFATWWKTALWIKDWPQSKGIKAYFIRGHELFSGDPNLVRQTYLLPYKKFVISNWLRKVMAEDYNDDSASLIPNGVDGDQFYFKPRNKQVLPTVGLLFGVTKIKGATTAFNVLTKLQQTLPELQVVCFGAHKISSEYVRPRNFKYYYRPEQDVIPEIYRSVDCWLVPSTTEGFGMPGLEAAACGCPIVSTRCGGPEDYLEEGQNGYLVNVGDEQNMIDKLQKVLNLSNRDWKNMSTKSAGIAKQFDWDNSAEQLEKALYELLEPVGQRN